jgi:hypothetical protein
MRDNVALTDRLEVMRPRPSGKLSRISSAHENRSTVEIFLLAIFAPNPKFLPTPQHTGAQWQRGRNAL